MSKTALSHWTSMNAFRSILPVITQKQNEVLTALIEFTVQRGKPPTAMELTKFMGRSQRDTVLPRLNELRQERNACHHLDRRKCESTGNPAVTWGLGPEPGKTLDASKIVKTPARPRKTAQQILADWGIPPGQPVNCGYVDIIPLVEAAMQEGADHPSV